MKNKIKQSTQIKNDLIDNTSINDNDFIKSVENSRIRGKDTFCIINKQDSSLYLLNNESSETYGINISNKVNKNTAHEKGNDNLNIKNNLKKIIFEKDVKLEDFNKFSSTLKDNKNETKYSYDVIAKSKLPQKINKIEGLLNSDSNANKKNIVKSSKGFRNSKTTIKIREEPIDKSVKLPISKDSIDLKSKNFLNLNNEHLKKELNRAFTSTNFIYNNHNSKKSDEKRRISKKNSLSKNSTSIHFKNLVGITNSSRKLTNTKISDCPEVDNVEKIIEKLNVDKNIVIEKKTPIKLNLEKLNRKFNSDYPNKILFSNQNRTHSTGKYYQSATKRKENERDKIKLFKPSNSKNKGEKNLNQEILMKEKSMKKLKWINESFLKPAEKSNIVESKTEKKEDIVLKSNNEVYDPEVNAIYNKLFDKYFRKIIDTKTPKTKDLQDQIRKYLKLRGKPCYIDDKIKDIKTKIFFMKGIFDFVYPEVLADKLKMQKEYYENIINEMQESNKRKQEKTQTCNKNQESNEHIASEFYIFNNRAKSSKNYYPKIHSSVKSDLKIKTHTKNFFRNILSSQSRKKKDDINIFSNLDKFLKMQNRKELNIL